MRNNFISILALLLISGCSLQLDSLEKAVSKTLFVAEIEQPADTLATRTVLGGTSSNTSRQILWCPSDEIYVAAGGKSSKFVNTSATNSATATFEGSISASDTYYAAYPYNYVTGFSSSKFSLTLPSVQTYRKDGFYDDSFPMVAKTGGSTFKFFNLCGIFVLNLTGSGSVESIVFSADDDSSPIPVAGAATVSMDYGSYPEIQMQGSYPNGVSSSVTLKCPSPVVLDTSTPTPFHIILPPGTYQRFKILVCATDGTIMQIESSNPMTIIRSKSTVASSLTYKGAEYVIIHKDAYAKKEVNPYRAEFVKIGEKDDNKLYDNYPTPVLVYNGVLDLKQYVETYCTSIGHSLPEIGRTPTYKFEFAGWQNGKAVYGMNANSVPYIGTDNVTNQNMFVTLTEDGIMQVDGSFVSSLTPAIGRTPLVKVTSYCEINGISIKLAEAFIKVAIIDEKPLPETPLFYRVFVSHSAKFHYESLTNYPTYKGYQGELNVTWEEFYQYILNELNLSYAEFCERYNLNDIMVVENPDAMNPTYVNNPDVLDAGVSYSITAPINWEESIPIMRLGLSRNFQVAPGMTKTDSLIVVYRAKNNYKDYDVGIKFVYTVDRQPNPAHEFVIPDFKLNPDYILDRFETLYFGTNPASAAKFDAIGGVAAVKSGYSSTVMEHFKEYSAPALKDGRILFLIKNFTSDEVAFTTPAGYFDQWTVRDSTISGKKYSCLMYSAQEWNRICSSTARNVSGSNGADIKMVGTDDFASDKDVLIEVIEECSKVNCNTSSDTRKVGYYYVEFRRMFEIKTQNIELGTYYTRADCENIEKFIYIFDRNNYLLFYYDETACRFVATPYAETEYGFTDAIVTVTFDKFKYNTIDTQASFGDDLLWHEANYAVWWNLGTELMRDKTAQYEFKIKIESGEKLYNMNGIGGITVLSTEHTETHVCPQARAIPDIANCYNPVELKPSSAVKVTGITLSTTSPITLRVGESRYVAATVVPSNALNKGLTWKMLWATKIATVSADGLVTAVSPGTAWVYIFTLDGGYKASCEVTVIDTSAEYVDLGLSVKWASCNLGASKPEEYGGYYQWAGTKDVSSTSIYLDWSNCPYHTGSSSSTGLTKYNTKSSYGTVDNKTVLDSSDDAAHVNWGGSWRMPTYAEWEELLGNCTWTWTTQNGVNGYRATSKKSGYTNKSIFLPAAGFRNYGSLYDAGSYGNYWSSSLITDAPRYAYYVSFYSGIVYWYGNSYRCLGKSVRPVSE